MKSEHRHELAENNLAKLLAKWGAEFDKHANTILSVLIVVALIAAGIIYWTRTSAATSALGWTELVNAGTAEDLQSIAEGYAGTEVAEWATLRAADDFLREGILLSLSDRPASNERLAQARESYQALLNNTGAPQVLREQALLGNAVTLESLSDGDTNEALTAYEKLLSEFPETRFKAYVDHRIAELKSGQSQDFYAWFHRLNPKPADLPGPQDQPKLPDAQDLSNLLPELGGSGIPETAPFTVPDSGEGDAKDVNPFADEEMKDKADKSESKTEKPQSDETKPESPDDKGNAGKGDAQKGDLPSSSTDQPAPEKSEAPAPDKQPQESKAPPADQKPPAESPGESEPSTDDSGTQSE